MQSLAKEKNIVNETKQSPTNAEDTITVKRLWLAKKLLKSGYQIVDIISVPDNRYLNFIFKNTEGLEDAINKAEEKNNKRKERRHHGYSEYNDDSVRISPEDLMKKFDEIKQQIQAVADNKIIK